MERLKRLFLPLAILFLVHTCPISAENDLSLETIKERIAQLYEEALYLAERISFDFSEGIYEAWSAIFYQKKYGDITENEKLMTYLDQARTTKKNRALMRTLWLITLIDAQQTLAAEQELSMQTLYKDEAPLNRFSADLGFLSDEKFNQQGVLQVADENDEMQAHKMMLLLDQLAPFFTELKDLVVDLPAAKPIIAGGELDDSDMSEQNNFYRSFETERALIADLLKKREAEFLPLN